MPGIRYAIATETTPRLTESLAALTPLAEGFGSSGLAFLDLTTGGDARRVVGHRTQNADPAPGCTPS